MGRTTPAAAFRIEVPGSGEDAVIALLSEHGTLGVEHAPAAGLASVLVAYFEPSPDLERRLCAGLSAIEGARLERHAFPEIDWVARFRAGFRAFEAAGFRIVPEWDQPPQPLDPRTLVVDPGRAFGTGTHETTRLCLAALERLARDRGLGQVVDLGTGTGLLGIAALRLGAVSSVAVDNDPDALVSARRHAQLNGAPLQLVAGDCGRPLQVARFDTVVANLMAPLLLERRDEILGLRRPAGRLVLSGLLAADLGAIREAYGPAGALAEAYDGEWAALIVGATAP